MENFWNQIAAAASGAGRPCVLAYPRIGSVPEIIQQSPLEVLEFHFSIRRWVDVWRGLVLLRRRQVRGLYLTDWPQLHWAYLLWRLVGVKRIVLHVHTSAGEGPPATGLRALLKDGLHRLRVFSANLYVAVSEHVRGRLLTAGRIPDELCTIVVNGIRIFSCDASGNARIRARIGVPEDAVLVVLVSRATYAKGVDFAVRCVANVLRDSGSRQLYAIHCGDGPDLPAFEALAQDLGIQERFRFLGRRTDVREILCAADIAFHASRSEAMSLAVLEFMCAGLAVLTSDTPSVCAAFEPGISGLTYRRDDLESAGTALRTLMEDQHLRRRLGVAASESCRRRYSLETMNAAFVEKVLPSL
jgi:glycosyltransferase involved in cell wall biosynthesis